MARIHALLDDVLARGGSDLHLAVGYPPLVRRRGELTPLRERAVDTDELTGILVEILEPELRARLTGELDLDFTYTLGENKQFRAHCFHKATGLAAVFHLVPSGVLSLEDLGCPEVVRRICDRTSGLVLCAGPAGAGKSTTIAAMVDYVNQKRACHVMTLERPVEILHAPVRAQITQRAVGPHATSFASAIRSAARQDVDVLAVGDLDGSDALAAALDLAAAGRLVLAAVPGASAPATIDRLLHGVPADDRARIRGLLADVLVAIVAQKLLLRADGSGRVAAYEILLGSAALASMIREDKTSDMASLMQAGGAVGMQTLDAAIDRLYQRGMVSADEAAEHMVERDGHPKGLARRTAPNG